jgi:phage shock protein PspC (stress-responsive transcriptional regulator)
MLSSAPFFRDDTLFGVCQALGEDFGFNANILRAIIGAGLLFSPVATVAAYAAAAVLVIVSRLLVPDPAIVSPLCDDLATYEEAEAEPQLPLAA